MKTVLVGINSKYIHTCLAVWYLKASLKNTAETVVREFTINDSKDGILAEIYKEKPHILAFSCYVWNYEMVKVLIPEIKKLIPKCFIILGGPEVSYTAAQVLKDNAPVDFVLCGEGEEVLPALTQAIQTGSKEYKTLKGIAYREDKEVIYREGFNLVAQLDRLNSPYTDALLDSAENRIIYYESSRGCPFNCSYCISSTFNGVRFFSFERVKAELEKLLRYKPKLIKFVDRTFNCNKKRAKEIIEYIISQECSTVFHFEAAADLFDDEMLELLRNAPKGRIQLEIGLQTTNPETLEEIDRITDLNKLRYNVEGILAGSNIHVHLDLIAGLPFEDINSFRKSFNEVYDMRPHQIQLGFLKMLKGARVRSEAEKHGYIYRDFAPYEILENKYIKFQDILDLKDVEEIVERYFNSGRYQKALMLLEKIYSGDCFELYKTLSVYCRKNGYLDRPIAYRENVGILFNFVKAELPGTVNMEEFRQAMVFDFLSSDSSCAIPDTIRAERDFIPANRIHEILKSQDFIRDYLPGFADIPAKNIMKKVFFVSLDLITKPEELLIFDYHQKDEVDGKYRNIRIKG